MTLTLLELDVVVVEVLVVEAFLGGSFVVVIAPAKVSGNKIKPPSARIFPRLSPPTFSRLQDLTSFDSSSPSSASASPSIQAAP
jgi:hypothetical protein